MPRDKIYGEKVILIIMKFFSVTDLESFTLKHLWKHELGHKLYPKNLQGSTRHQTKIVSISVSFLSFTSLAELEKEVHNIKSGLKALEAVSCYVFVSRSLPLVLLLSVIMFLSMAEMDNRVTCLNAGMTWNGKCHICSRTQKQGFMCTHTWRQIHILLHRDPLFVFLSTSFLSK